MKCLTVCQPYAHRLCVIGDKPVENRGWPTSHRGPLLIHAGKSTQWMQPGDNMKYRGMVFGAIVGMVNVVDCCHVGRITDRHARLVGHPDASGPYCWIVRDPRRLTCPIKYRGAQGLFEVPDDVIEDEQMVPVKSRAEMTVHITAKLYEARDTLRLLLGNKYQASVDAVKPILRRAADMHGGGNILNGAAWMLEQADNDGPTQLRILAAATDMIEAGE